MHLYLLKSKLNCVHKMIEEFIFTCGFNSLPRCTSVFSARKTLQKIVPQGEASVLLQSDFKGMS